MSDLTPTDDGRRPVRRMGSRPVAEVDADEGVGGHHPTDPRGQRRAEIMVAALFLLSALGTVVFIVAYIFGDIHTEQYGRLLNTGLGLALTLSLAGIGTAFILWAKNVMPHEVSIQERHPFASSDAEFEAMQRTVFDGVAQSQVGRRSLLRRSMFLAMGVLALPAVVILRDLGPAPEQQLRHTAWRKGMRLVDPETMQPVRMGDLQVGAIKTVVPPTYHDRPVEDVATSPTILIRLGPGENNPLKGRETWAVDDHVAYNKICTHMGCPTSLFEQQTHHLLCPCHQSTFDVANGCKVIFGPAARALPQLPLALDDQGYFIAQSDYTEPVGPSFWERG